MMKIHLVGDEIAKGQGVGRGSVVGHAIVADSASDLEGKDLSDKVIITNSVDETLVPYVEKAIGLITERKWYYFTKRNYRFRKRYTYCCWCRTSN